MAKGKDKGKGKGKDKKTRKTARAKKDRIIRVSVGATVPTETIEGTIKTADANGVIIERKRPRSSKMELLMVPASEVVAYGKGAGKKAPDVLVRRVPASAVVVGKAEDFKAGEKPEVIVDGARWVVNPTNAIVNVVEEL